MNSKSTTILGIMSGTSLDGLDIALCSFIEQNGSYQYSIHKAVTIDYPRHLAQQLQQGPRMKAHDFVHLDKELGHFIGEECRKFIEQQKIIPQAIASHGHTIFHDIQGKVTAQIGNGAEIHAAAGLPVVCDFRSVDIALGGQGAPLVPVGDQLLFEEYGGCINLGGIANISYNQMGNRLAYDICAVNIVLNRLAGELGHAYDDEGKIARSGNLNYALLEKLESLSFYRQKPPKSLGIEWVEREVFPILYRFESDVKDKMRTYTEHIAIRLADEINRHVASGQKVLFTGGGAHNRYLMEQVAQWTSSREIVVPDKDLINFKEALLFAFLGYLRLENKPNCLKTVTGASKDNVGGAIYG